MKQFFTVLFFGMLIMCIISILTFIVCLGAMGTMILLFDMFFTYHTKVMIGIGSLAVGALACLVWFFYAAKVVTKAIRQVSKENKILEKLNKEQ